MLIALFPIIVLIVGLLIWAIASAAEKPSSFMMEVGRIMFFCGLLVLCFVAAKHTIHVP